MADETSLIDSIEKIEAASRRTHPFMLLGLLAIVAGFVFLVINLNRLRNEAEAQATRWETTATRLEGTLKAAREAVSNREMERAASLLGTALRQTQQLVTVAQQANPASPAVTANPRVPARPPSPRPGSPARSANAPPQGAETDLPPCCTSNPRGIVLVNATTQTIGCGSRVAFRQTMENDEPWQPPYTVAAGAQMSLGPGRYVCGVVGRRQQEYDFGVGDARRYVLTLASDGTVSAAPSAQ